MLVVVALFLQSGAIWAQEAPAGPGASEGQAAAEQASEGADGGPLYGSNTSSPREVIASFQRLSKRFQDAMDFYAETHDRKGADRIRRVLDQWLSLIDLSEVPEATRREVGAETAAYFLDIFNRIPLPALDAVPDATAFTSSSSAVYLVPNTPFSIIRIDSGSRQGEFLFSGNSVRSAEQFHGTVEDLAPRSPGPVRSWAAEFRQFTGPMIPAGLADTMPESLKRPVLGTPIWKIIAVVVTMSATALLLFGWNRVTTHPAWGGLVGDRWRLLLSPLAVLVAGVGLRTFFSAQIVIAGQVAVATYASLTLVIFLALAWAFWVFVLAAFETAIQRSDRPDQGFDANMLRLIARILGFLGGLIILAYGAQDIGLPVFSLLAGLGIGGIAIALAIRPTLENLIGGFVLYLDRPIRVGDFCSFGDTSGSVESIGIRSTQLRASDRTLITVPNAQFADMQIVNWAQCDRLLIKQTIRLRYETDEDQLRYVIAKLREMLIGHPRIDSDSVRVRFANFGESSLDVDIRVYAVTRDWNDFFAIREDVQFRVMSIVAQSGTGFAIPSQTVYLGKDGGLDADRSLDARREVSAWRRDHQLPFPNLAEARQRQLDGKLHYPPPGSPDFNVSAEDLEDAGHEPLSAPQSPDEGDRPVGQANSSDETGKR